MVNILLYQFQAKINLKCMHDEPRGIKSPNVRINWYHKEFVNLTPRLLINVCLGPVELHRAEFSERNNDRGRLPLLAHLSLDWRRFKARMETGNKSSLKFERFPDSHQLNMLLTWVSMKATILRGREEKLQKCRPSHLFTILHDVRLKCFPCLNKSE